MSLISPRTIAIDFVPHAYNPVADFSVDVVSDAFKGKVSRLPYLIACLMPISVFP